MLIDMTIDDGGQGFDVGEFGQEAEDQVAWDEAFLSLDGTAVLSRDERPEGERCRLAFFLHFYDPEQPLETPFGPVRAPEPAEMPAALKELIPYEPVD